MKKIILITIFLLLFSLTLSARPQFFFGSELEWGRVYPGEDEYNSLKQNSRYYNPDNYSTKDVVYIAELIPRLSLTYIPIADIGLGVNLSLGYGFVTGTNTGNSTYAYYNKSWNYTYQWGSDDIIKLSTGLKYIFTADKEKYLSFNAFLGYEWARYSLDNEGEKGRTELDRHSLLLSVGLMERYDKYYFSLDCNVSKPLNDLQTFFKTGYSFNIRASLGVVFTILKEGEYMR